VVPNLYGGSLEKNPIGLGDQIFLSNRSEEAKEALVFIMD